MSYKNIKSKFRMAGNVYLNGDTFESMRSLHQDLTFDDAGKSFARYGVDFGEDKVIALGLRNIHDDQYTNLALLLSDQCQHTIKVAVFADEARTVFKDAKEFGGSLFRQLEDAYSYLLLCNRTASTFQGLERMEKKDYPEEALREALLNAMVHRDYSFSGSIIINVNDVGWAWNLSLWVACCRAFRWKIFAVVFLSLATATWLRFSIASN